ncbi:hypothetical protein B0H13DRAFT_1890757 [Mycena leptocephala]|nr:hypothetical protein B0H13DRAFT_1890757 [Mycena leptocephala]
MKIHDKDGGARWYISVGPHITPLENTHHLPPGQDSICNLAHIEIKALTYHHDDLPSDMHMLAQAIIDKRLVLRTTPVAMEPSQSLWKLTRSWKIAELADGLWLAIMRHSKTRGTRLLGSIQIETGKALASEENKICLSPDVENYSITENYGISALNLNLIKVNLDGPLLELAANFSISQPSVTEPYEGIQIADLQIFIVLALLGLEIPERFLGLDPIDSLTSFISKSGCTLQGACIAGKRLFTKNSYHLAFPLIQTFLFSGRSANDEEEGPELP